MKREILQAKIALVLSYITGLIFILLPFHALLTTWLGSNFNHLDLFRIWKEIILVPLALISLWLYVNDKKVRRWLRQTGLLYLLIGYLALYFVLGAIALAANRVNTSALIYSLFSNLRYLAFFFVCLVIASQTDWLTRHWKKLVLIPAAIVIIFGLLQHFILPVDFLRHFGYGPKTIPAFQAVDQKLAYVRIQSVFRGPNPLGAYLVLITSLFAALALKDTQRRTLWLIATLMALLTNYFTYSRSAWLGSILALFILSWHWLKNPKLKRYVLSGLSLLILIGASSVIALRHNDRIQNTFFHTDEHSHSAESSNFDRTSALKNGLKDIEREPWGRGPGTAGPASTRNNHPARIAENYYLQIGQEVGVVGLIIFLAINLILAVALWKQKSVLSIALFASLIGLTLVNMLSHAWADDTLGLLFFGLVGIALARPLSKKTN